MIIATQFALCFNSRKGKPIARWGRKVMDLHGNADRQTAEGENLRFFYLDGPYFLNGKEGMAF